MNYYYLNDFPLSIAKGGKEEQLKFVSEVAKKVFTNVQYFDNSVNLGPSSESFILHCFGDSPHFLDTIKFLKGQNKNPILIINPNFYRRSPLVYRLANLLPSIYPNWYSKRKEMYNLAKFIIVNSHYEKHYLIKIFGRQLEEKITVIYNTFEKTQLNAVTTNKTNFNEKFYLIVSHLNERKNIFNLVRASKNIYEKYGYRLKIIGGLRFSNPNNVERFINMLEDNQHIDYLGEQEKDTVYSYLSECAFHILPSFIESPGISNLEAASINKPLIVGDFPILREYFGEKIVYTKFNAQSIRKSIELLLNNPKQESIDLSFCSKESISADYIKLFKGLND